MRQVGRRGPRSTVTSPYHHPVIARLIRARKSRHLSQTEVAQRIGVGVHTLNSWEIGRHEPRMSMLTAWAEVLGFKISLADLGPDQR